MNSIISFRAVLNSISRLSLLVLVGAQTASADTFIPAFPYAVTSGGGGYVFKMIPSTDEAAQRTETPSGTGTAYAVKSDGQLVEIWQTSGWYSRQTFVGAD